MSTAANRTIANFPFLTRDEFEDVCKSCLPLFQEEPGRDMSTSAKLVKVVGEAEERTCSLNILTHTDLHGGTKLGSDSSGEHDDDHFSGTEDDLDEEALKDKVPPASLNRLRIEYEILLSPSYRVPVLYFRIRNGQTQLITDVDVVYTRIVPQVYREQLHDVGIIGGISMANHPVTDVPSFFIHPCQTASALAKAADNRQVLIDDYLPLWMGIIGVPVGLSIPTPTQQSNEAHSGPILG